MNPMNSNGYGEVTQKVESSRPLTQPTEPFMEHAFRPVKNALMTNITPYIMTNISLTYNSIAAYNFSLITYQKMSKIT
jgi:hypothetical protein